MKGSELKRQLLAVVTVTLLVAVLIDRSSASDDYGKFKFGGSMRGRYELFRFSEDETGSKKDTRGRIRYRFRFDGSIAVNPHASFFFRFVSGDDSRSGNQTLGEPYDFGPNLFSVRSASMTLTPWADGKLPNGKGYWKFDFGRVKNSFVWKGNGRDMMLWDNDISLAGTGTQFGHQLGQNSSFFFNTGYYVIDEESSGGKDPYLTPLQLGLLFGADNTRAGIRGSFWYMNELNANFISRGATGENLDGSDGVTASGGNISDGLTGDPEGGKLEVLSTQAFLSTRIASVRFTMFGGYSSNLTAEPSQRYPGIAKNNIAYNIGLEGGNKKSLMLLGAAWFHIEANAFPSQFIDSDFLDGHTNRKGLLIYFSKQVIKNTDFNIQLFGSDAIAVGTGLEESVENSERVRLQVDLLYNF